MEKEYTYIDLFAGCGGLSLGLHNAGWKGTFALEKNKQAFATLKFNLIDKEHFDWPDWLPKKKYEIDYFLKKYKTQLENLSGKIDLVVGGPPCQGFSTAGARKEDDKRNKLVHSYIKFISIVKPKLIFFENVKGFTFEFKKKNKKGRTYSAEVVEELEKLNYKLEHKIVDFSEYGIPQARHRFILIGKLECEIKGFFDKLEASKANFLTEKGISNKTSLSDAISDLLSTNGKVDCPDSEGFFSGKYSQVNSAYQELMRNNLSGDIQVPDSHRFVNHTKEIAEQFQHILNYCERNKTVDKEIKNKFNIKKRSITPLAKDKPCPVLTSIPDEYVHYEEPRVLTVREYARIQSFPDHYEIKEKYTTGGQARKQEVPRYTQLANAVPPLFAEMAGVSLKELLKDE